jgi:hypothetical protein
VTGGVRTSPATQGKRDDGPDTTTECSVLHCSSPGDRSWSTGDTETDYAYWAARREHHALLRSGVDFATQGDIAISLQRSIVMGADLELRDTDDLQASVVGFQLTGSGKEMEIELATGQETFDGILDKEQATEMGEAVGRMSELLPEPPTTNA